MAREQHRRPQPFGPEIGWLVLGAFLVLLLGIGFAVWAGAQVNSSLKPVSDPVTLLIDVVSGQVPMTFWQGAITFSIVAALVGVAVLLAVAWRRNDRGTSRIDYKARFLGTESDVDELLPEQAARDAARLRATAAGLGSTLGTHLPSGKPLYASWEWVQVWLMGPRAGKTSCVCVPQILETKGPAMATGNKPDIVDLTRGPRSEVGMCWVQDPQQIIGETASWWWDMTSFVTDLETAGKLADVFITSATDAGARQDAYFGSAAKELFVYMLLAAALDDRPITDVYTWLHDPDSIHSDNPARILNMYGKRDLAVALESTQRLTPKQRDGVYGTTHPWVAVLGSEHVRPWITDPTGGRPKFDPARFVLSTDTLYLVSKEGGGTARAITGALTMAVLEAAERAASTSPGGRLPMPLSVVLDEVANVCRWRELPDVYSHYGSRGIVVSSFFQSWAQGVEAFGEHGMAKIWSAANIRGVGAGLSDDKFLPMISNLIGDRDAVKRTESWRKSQRDVSTSIQRERIFDVSDIGALPRGRVLVTGSGLPAFLLRLDHFSKRAAAEKVSASQRYYENRRTTRNKEAA
jgi:type IV secretory pathway TraG/TraD family ATPase VirD4